jgi:hypothetical protein
MSPRSSDTAESQAERDANACRQHSDDGDTATPMPARFVDHAERDGMHCATMTGTSADVNRTIHVVATASVKARLSPRRASRLAARERL